MHIRIACAAHGHYARFFDDVFDDLLGILISFLIAGASHKLVSALLNQLHQPELSAAPAKAIGAITRRTQGYSKVDNCLVRHLLCSVMCCLPAL